MPHQGVDPVTAGAAIVTSLQQIVSREVNPTDAAVVSVTKFHAGEAMNVISSEARLGGTIRALTNEGLNYLKQRVVEVAEAIGAAHRCSITDWKFMSDRFPPTVNDGDVWSWLQSPHGAGLTNEIEVRGNMDPSMGSEDFAYYLEDVPGAFILLGIGTGAGHRLPTNVSLHNPRFNIDENALSIGAALHANLALRSLEQLERKAEAEL
eukprot:gnl/MRDRNA2_/MRDRNA2_392397_c0_seq1.p1 gnl/MRDRNA2_/MRDRNA2_392397_c0~~gnl/MRDRNA2_/MRDRNA2_392397_c0_seq1.p1  ORF type:complete len:218 (+),score=56.63 gnl/MRDRNA2_/MRDRNA2_392397_c0_seq1:31-654(+)